MSGPLPDPADLREGDALPPASYKVDWEDLLRFNRYVSGGEDTKNIHTDDETARRAGLPGAIAAGRHPVSFIAERMVDLFGPGFVSGGELEVTFVKPIFPGETVRLSARVRERREREGGRIRLVLEVALLNGAGEAVTVGSASGWVDG